MGINNTLPEIRKEAFTKARESLGLSVKDLSGMTCLSVRQIEQIENGETSSFYGAQVKFTAAKKVAALLKLKPEDAFEFNEFTQSAKASDIKEKLKEETTFSLGAKNSPAKKTEDIAQAKVVESNSAKSESRKISESATGLRAKSPSAVDPKKKFFLLLAIAAAVIFSVVNLRPLFFPEPVKEEVVIIQEVAQEPPPASVPAEPATEAKAAPALDVRPEVANASSECPPLDASPFYYKPDAPKKAGDMVYLQSKTAQIVCVVDAAGKTQSKSLEPGVGASVFGKPPLKVLTGGLNQVDLYYQGAKVRTGNTNSKTIVLEPVEIVQPAASSVAPDSQLR